MQGTGPLRLGIVGVAAAGTFLLQGCLSAYQGTYEQTTRQLEKQRLVLRSQDGAAHAEATRYAAVLYFANGSSVLGEDAERELGRFVLQVRSHPKAVVLVQGFADTTGSEAANRELSQQRAATVASFLRAHGIDQNRVVMQGFGQQYPDASSASAPGRRDNRRVEVTVR